MLRRVQEAATLPRWFAFLLVGCAFHVVGPTAALANDAAMGGRGIDLSPVQETRIRMVSEDIRLSQTENATFAIEATYTFENPSEEAVSLRMGFPERRCGPDSIADCNGDGSFTEMQTRVAGEAVEHAVEDIGPLTEWGEELGRVFVFDVDFAPGERKVVEHHYTYTGTDTVMGIVLEYVTRTGALWATPIEDARFTITFNEPVCEMWLHESAVAAISQRSTNSQGTSVTLHYENWVPERDVVFSLIVQGWDACTQMMSEHCPLYSTTDLMEASASVLDDMSREVAVDPQYDLDELRVCRNLPYAMQGYPFRSSDLREIFYERNNDAGFSDGTRRLRMSANTAEGARDSFQLTDLHSRYVRVIQGAERIRSRALE